MFIVRPWMSLRCKILIITVYCIRKLSLKIILGYFPTKILHGHLCIRCSKGVFIGDFRISSVINVISNDISVYGRFMIQCRYITIRSELHSISKSSSTPEYLIVVQVQVTAMMGQFSSKLIRASCGSYIQSKNYP